MASWLVRLDLSSHKMQGTKVALLSSGRVNDLFLSKLFGQEVATFLNDHLKAEYIVNVQLSCITVSGTTPSSIQFFFLFLFLSFHLCLVLWFLLPQIPPRWMSQRLRATQVSPGLLSSLSMKCACLHFSRFMTLRMRLPYRFEEISDASVKDTFHPILVLLIFHR